MDFVVRQRRLRAEFDKLKIEAMLITHMPNIRYLCGFTGSAGVLLVGEKNVLITDGRYTEQAKHEAQGAKVVIAKGPALMEAARQLARKSKLCAGIEADHLTVALKNVLAKALPAGVRLKDTRGVVESLRMLKDAVEVALMRDAIELGAELLPRAFRAIRPGVSELRVAAEIEYGARRRGAEGMSFETIVASGPRSALPHGVATEAPIPAKGFVVLDFGVILHGYCSDMTRTVHVGKAGAEERGLYGAVLEAQLASISAVRPGVTLEEVDGAGRSVLKKARLDKYFTHSTGHGVGLEIHEPPRVAKGQTDVLKPGMVITIEPGIYLAGRCGIRIEDVVAVTERGYELLTPARKELIEL